MSDLKKTPLYDLHLQLGAKMTAFAGYAMPVQYAKGIIHEHLHCRSQAGLFDISHMGQCRVSGDNAVAEFDKLTLGGLSDLTVGAQKYTVLTNADGGVIDDIIVTRIESGLFIIVNAGCKDKDFAHLRQRLSPDCLFEECADLALLALQGPLAQLVLAACSANIADLRFMQSCETTIQDIPCFISRSGYTGEDGFEISVSEAHAQTLASVLLAHPGVEPIGLGARDTLRLEAGLPLYGHELTEHITPIEAGLQWLLKKGHTAFPGADKILHQRQLGAETRRVGLLVDGKMPVREGCLVYDHEDRQIGYVTSGSFAPNLNRPVAMALIDRNFSQIGQTLFAKVRDRLVTVNVCALPFVPHRYRR